MRPVLALAFALAALFGSGAGAAAQTPVAVVEDVASKSAGVSFMDYVVAGQVIKLAPKDTLTLGYMKSCWRETITGGTVVAGAEQSMIHQGEIARVRVDCDAGRMQLTDRQASESAATVFRGMTPAQQAALPPQITLFGLSPVVEANARDALVIERLDQPGERYEAAANDKSRVRGRFYDLAKAGKALAPGGLYVASAGQRKIVFKIDPAAKPGDAPVIGRLLRLD